MHIIKLNATASTNDYLKNLAKDNVIKNKTVVVAKEQLYGRGQMNTKWESEKGKNLLFSMICYFDELNLKNQFYINYAISNAVYNVLDRYIPTLLTVKWPNDIMSDNKKICGILIENKIKKDTIVHSIIGIGLNVNQEIFLENKLNATSIKKITGKSVSKMQILKDILKEIEDQLALFSLKRYDELKLNYLNNLFKFKKPTMFITKNKHTFMGKITGVSSQGKLQITLEDNSISEFGVKEISFLKI